MDRRAGRLCLRASAGSAYVTQVGCAVTDPSPAAGLQALLGVYIVRVARPGRKVPALISCGSRGGAERLAKRLRASGCVVTIAAGRGETR